MSEDNHDLYLLQQGGMSQVDVLREARTCNRILAEKVFDTEDKHALIAEEWLEHYQKTVFKVFEIFFYIDNVEKRYKQASKIRDRAFALCYQTLVLMKFASLYAHKK